MDVKNDAALLPYMQQQMLKIMEGSQGLTAEDMPITVFSIKPAFLKKLVKYFAVSEDIHVKSTDWAIVENPLSS